MKPKAGTGIPNASRLDRGYSLLEAMLALLVTAIMMTAVLGQIGQMQQRARAEELKLDIFQQSREFMDQFTRDVRQTGYPSKLMFDAASFSANSVAVGVTKIAADEIVFEGDVDGDGRVDVLDYKRVASGNNCPCLQRSQVLKSTGTTVFSSEVQNITSAGTSADPLFVGYSNTGTAVTSADTSSLGGQQSLASLKTIQFTVRVEAGGIDPKTGQTPETSLAGQGLIRNCSIAATGQSNSCQ